MPDQPVPHVEAKPSKSISWDPADIPAEVLEIADRIEGDYPAAQWAARAYMAGRAQAAADIREYALNYPADVFPPDSDVRDAIAGTAMRHAYNNAAEIAEGEADLSKDPT